jgi:hypothetical protein
MIKSELDFIYITSDGKRFITEDEARRHEELEGRKTDKAEHRLRYDN